MRLAWDELEEHTLVLRTAGGVPVREANVARQRLRLAVWCSTCGQTAPEVKACVRRDSRWRPEWCPE